MPTHSLLNYSQWKIISPEAALIGIPTVDGYIAQVWTGTSRCANVYEGVYRERTFETAYLEYGVMQELVKGTGRRMWFLNDPIEDAPGYTWENYRYNYIKTATASLLHPHVWHYEICPWPQRVFDEKYPKVQPDIAQKDESGYEIQQSRPIPGDYATLLSSMFQLFGDMDQPKFQYEGMAGKVGILMSDSAMFQRTFPDGVVTGKCLADLEVFNPSAILNDESLLMDYIHGPSFPQFFGLSMPLLKWGLPIRPVQLDNVLRFDHYLAGNDLLVLSYEYIKPISAEVNEALVSWIRSGGTLVYVGDGSDPYHRADLWRRERGYSDPAAHLFELAGLKGPVTDGSYPVGNGKLLVWNQIPARITLDRKLSDEYRKMIHSALADRGICWEYRNDLTLRRGPYVISAVMDESVSASPKVIEGRFVDLLEVGFPIITHKEILPDQCALLLDLDAVEGEEFRVIGTCARITPVDSQKGLCLKLQAADRIRAFARLRLPFVAREVTARATGGNAVSVDWNWDENTNTVLIAYDSTGEEVSVVLR